MKLKNTFIVFGLALAMFIAASQIILALCVINRNAVEKDLGFPFKPIPIKGKLAKFFWGKWTWDFFECNGIRKISLMVFILSPLNLLMLISILAYLVMAIISVLTDNAELMSFNYEKYGCVAVMYIVFLGVLTTVLSHWANMWKRPKVSIKEQIEFRKELDRNFKKQKIWKRHYALRQELRSIAYSSNKKRGEYWFERSQIPQIEKLIKKSFRKGELNLVYSENRPHGFAVLDSTNNETVFQGLFKD